MDGPIRIREACIWAALILSSGAAIAQEDCPTGTLYEPYREVCAEVRDKRDEFLPQTAADRAYKVFGADSLGLGPEDEPPVPGSLAVGITYLANQLVALEQGYLHTRMFVYPDGLRPDGYLNWLFTPATTRVMGSLELAGAYRSEMGDRGSLGLFAWTCKPDYVCPDGDTSPGWQWFRNFYDLTCNITQEVDQGGHAQKILYYANHADKLDDGAPPLWKSAVYLWNYCDEAWDLAWEHIYRDDKIDCSVPGSGCAWWGPGIEIYGSDPYPQIAELGFEDSLLYHDGVWSELRPGEAGFREPGIYGPPTPWQLFHLDPNRSWGAGNFVESNEPPEIVGQDSLSTPEGSTLTITVDDVIITDPNIDPDYHFAFLLTIYDGENYSIDGNSVIPDEGFEGILTVPAQASDGWADSVLYDLKVHVTETPNILTVTKIEDTADGTCDADCSLREAVLAANELPGEVTIILPSGVYVLPTEDIEDCSSGTCTDELTGDLDFTKSLIVVGEGSDVTIIDGGGNSGIFEEVGADELQWGCETTLRLEKVTLRNGLTDKGGAVHACGLDTSFSVFSDNRAENGGAIFAAFMARVKYTRLSSNKASKSGGAVHSPDLLVDSSTLNGNEAADKGGGVYGDVYVEGESYLARAHFTDSTFSGNRGRIGGAVYIELHQAGEEAFFYDCTIADNYSSSGGAVAVPVVTAVQSIFANNTGGNCFYDRWLGYQDFLSEGYNLDTDGTCRLDDPTDLVGVDPLLAPLADNGGPTLTHALLAGSPAIDAIPSEAEYCEGTDQRGVSRPRDGDDDGVFGCDIGALEADGNPPPEVKQLLPLPDVDGNGTADYAVLYSWEDSGDGVQVRDGSTGALLAAFDFGTDGGLELAWIALDGGIALALLDHQPGESVQAIIHDALTGTLLNTVPFPPAYAPVGLRALRDQPLAHALVVLGVRENGEVRATIKDAATGALLSGMPFAPAYPPQFFELVPDVSGNGASELAVLGIDAEGNVRVQLKDAQSGALIHWIQYAKAFEQQAMVVVPVPDVSNALVPAIGVLQTHTDGRVRVQLKYAATREPLDIVHFSRDYPPDDITVLTDIGGGPAGELAVIAREPYESRYRVQIKDAATGEFLGKVFFARTFTPQSLDTLGDANGNLTPELAVLGLSQANQIDHRVQVKDSLTSAELHTALVP